MQSEQYSARVLLTSKMVVGLDNCIILTLEWYKCHINGWYILDLGSLWSTHNHEQIGCEQCMHESTQHKMKCKERPSMEAQAIMPTIYMNPLKSMACTRHKFKYERLALNSYNPNLVPHVKEENKVHAHACARVHTHMYVCMYGSLVLSAKNPRLILQIFGRHMSRISIHIREAS